jgi:hypothetical protein
MESQCNEPLNAHQRTERALAHITYLEVSREVRALVLNLFGIIVRLEKKNQRLEALLAKEEP